METIRMSRHHRDQTRQEADQLKYNTIDAADYLDAEIKRVHPIRRPFESTDFGSRADGKSTQEDPTSQLYRFSMRSVARASLLVRACRRRGALRFWALALIDLKFCLSIDAISIEGIFLAFK